MFRIDWAGSSWVSGRRKSAKVHPDLEVEEKICFTYDGMCTTLTVFFQKRNSF